MKDFLTNIRSNPIARIAVIVLGLFLLVVIVLMIFAGCSKKTMSYKKLESKMVTLAKNKYSKKSKLPQEDKGVLEVSLQSFVDDGSLNNIQDLVGSACTGSVKIINNNGFYLYLPYLDCGDDYKTTTFKDTIIKDSLVTLGNGLYNIGNEYIFKGDKVKNFVSFNDKLYRIIKINEDGTIRIVQYDTEEETKWDTHYNINNNYEKGINIYYHDGLNSTIKSKIESLYTNSFTDSEKAFLINTPVCVGARSKKDNIFEKIECNEILGEYPVSTLLPGEYYVASLDKDCTEIGSKSCRNYNYFTSLSESWTITADKDTSYRAFKVGSTGSGLREVADELLIRLVITVDGNLVIEPGTGTKKDPYIIKTFEKNK